MKVHTLSLATALFALRSASAAAQATDPVTAEVLFQEARALLQAGQLEQACPKFIESHRLDPATGTLLAVATCHERQGKLATAWSEFTKAAGRARQESSEDRMSLAVQRADELQPRLSTLSISVPPELVALPGLRIQRDGLEIGASTWNRALPIDGGEHTLHVSAPGYVSRSVTVSVGLSEDSASVTLPLLEREPLVASLPAGEAPGPRDTAPASGGMTTSRAVGIGLGAAGAGALAVGAVFLTGALIKKSEASDHCQGNACDPTGLALRSEAVDWGHAATALGIGGALLGAAGVTLYFVGAPDTGGELSLWVAPERATACWEVAF